MEFFSLDDATAACFAFIFNITAAPNIVPLSLSLSLSLSLFYFFFLNDFTVPLILLHTVPLSRTLTHFPHHSLSLSLFSFPQLYQLDKLLFPQTDYSHLCTHTRTYHCLFHSLAGTAVISYFLPDFVRLLFPRFSALEPILV